jgi:membrane protease YdiL (CAAX protease family)
MAAIGAAMAAAVLAPVLQLGIGPFSYVAGALAYLLVLTGLGIFLWLSFRLTSEEFGWKLGSFGDYVIAAGYPIIAMTALMLWATQQGAFSFGAVDGEKLLRDAAIMFAGTFIAVLITEEGFFRGALWGVATRAGWRSWSIVIWTTLAFVAWHIAVPFIDKEYAVPQSVLPLYFTNAVLLGLSWGTLRVGSGSVLVPACAHSMWNALAYSLFGSGDSLGALKITDVARFDPERGIGGVAVNGAIFLLIVVWAWRRRKANPTLG